MAEIDEQIAAEAKQLKDAPLVTPVVGVVHRCHICGKVMGAEQAIRFDAHIPNRVQRLSCQDCNAG